MDKKTYVVAGNWHYKPGPRGYSILKYDEENASMEMISTDFPTLGAGQQTVDQDTGIAYVVNEIRDLRNQVGGGGYLVAIKIEENGKMTLINEKQSLGHSPSYVCVDKSKKYCIVVHHAFHDHVTKVEKDADTGEFRPVTVFDDAPVVLFRINEDGSLGDACDVDIHPGEGPSGPHMISHLHSVVSDPESELFVVCDKGLDRIYSYGIDREEGKLKFLAETIVDEGMWPRYGVFHPTLPYYYSNNEKSPFICAFEYDRESGVLNAKGIYTTQDEESSGEASEASDIAIAPSGKYIYATDRSSNTISVMEVQTDGSLQLIQRTGCGGENPRGICLSPDSRFLIVANSDTASLDAFSIGPDGKLKYVKRSAEVPCPANLKFIYA